MITKPGLYRCSYENGTCKQLVTIFAITTQSYGSKIRYNCIGVVHSHEGDFPGLWNQMGTPHSANAGWAWNMRITKPYN